MECRQCAERSKFACLPLQPLPPVQQLRFFVPPLYEVGKELGEGVHDQIFRRSLSPLSSTFSPFRLVQNPVSQKFPSFAAAHPRLAKSSRTFREKTAVFVSLSQQAFSFNF
jgi:hypothetical protein